MSSMSSKHIFYSSIICLILILPLLAWAEESSDTILASKWIDREIYSKTGEQFGEIDDLVIKRSGKVKKITIEVGGFLDIGDKLVAVSLGELQNLMIKEDGKMVLDTTEEQMEKRSEFDYYREGLFPDYYYRPRYYNGYGYRYYPPPYPYYRPHGPQLSDRQKGLYPEDEPLEWAFSPARFLASAVMDRRMINESGAYIGRVVDLLIDTKKARIQKIILAAEDIRGTESLVALPYEAPGVTAYGLVYDIGVEEIKNLPSFTIKTD
jgi:sporulation protein YlmC with PRC-barrel domain